MAKLIRCPHCGKKTEYSEKNPFRPFCSNRCQLIDLGDWADGKYAVPAEENDQEPISENDKSESTEED